MAVTPVTTRYRRFRRIRGGNVVGPWAVDPGPEGPDQFHGNVSVLRMELLIVGITSNQRISSTDLVSVIRVVAQRSSSAFIFGARFARP